MNYNWQLLDWPLFKFELFELQAIFSHLTEKTGELSGILLGLGKELQQEMELEIMLSEALKSSEIEGEYVSRQDVMSSLKKNLGLTNSLLKIKDKRAPGLAQLLLAVKSSYNKKLTISTILEWHSMLMAGNPYISPGKLRIGEDPMQVVSGTIGKDEIHFEAPPSQSIPFEMERFVEWYNRFEIPNLGTIPNGILKSSLSHLYFESIHPFEDGNGRIGRAIAEHALSSVIKKPLLISLSKSIEKDKKRYYNELKNAQRTLEVKNWIQYFTEIAITAQEDAKSIILFTIKKTTLFDKFKDQLNLRQVKVIQKIFEQGTEGFEGGLTAKKYMAMTKCSKASATRDLHELYENGIFAKEGAGRSVRYSLA